MDQTNEDVHYKKTILIISIISKSRNYEFHNNFKMFWFVRPDAAILAKS